MENSKKSTEEKRKEILSKGSRKGDFKSDLFSFNPTKSERMKIRRLRDSYIRDFLKNQGKEEREKILIDFEEFYKSFYLKNDYSLESLSMKNSSPESKELIKSFLIELKKFKGGKK